MTATNTMLREQLNEKFSGRKWPFVSAAVQEDAAATVAVDIAPELVWFEGHFPDHPILPGVVQVHWAVEYARHLFVIEQPFQKIENLKFKSVVLPEMQLEMRFNHDPDKSLVRFVFGNADAVYSEGRITFAG